MDNNEGAGRTRWSPKELEDVARRFVENELAQPTMSALANVRVAQSVIDAERRRDILQWTAVKRLDPYIARFRADHSLLQQPAGMGGGEHAEAPDAQSSHDEQDDVSTSQAEVSLPGPEDAQREPAAQSIDVPTLGSIGGYADVAVEGSPDAGMGADEPEHIMSSEALGLKPTGVEQNDFFKAVPSFRDELRAAQQGSAEVYCDNEPKREEAAASKVGTSAIDPLMTEAALLVAIQSPAIEQALVGLFARAFEKAIAQAQDGGVTKAMTPVENDVRIMLAGFSDGESKTIADTLGSFDVRRWKSVQGVQMFKTLAGICSLAVVPEEADDEMVDMLRSMSVKVIRHQGNAGRVLDQVLDCV